MNSALILFAALFVCTAPAALPLPTDEISLNGAMERIDRLAYVYKGCVLDEDACATLADEFGREDSKAEDSVRCAEEDEGTPMACFVK